MNFVEFKSVSKSFGPADSRSHVLSNVNLTLREGEFVAIVGYSGSGKTTLINLLAGLVMPDTGSVTLEGKSITAPGPDRGLVFQNYSLLPWLTVFENISLAVDQVFPSWTAEQRRAHTEKYIAMVNLTPARNKLPRQLSGGMRQRVSVARGLAMDPKILLLDEPLGALDALTRGTLQDEIVRIWEADKKTVLMITNDVDEALIMADRVILLTTAPSATLADEFLVTLPRPRDRKELNHDPLFKDLRARITRRLIQLGERRKVTTSRAFELPNLLPEDLSFGRPLITAGREPRRRQTRTDITTVSS